MKRQDIDYFTANSRVKKIKTVKKGKYSEYFTDDDVADIKAQNLDFIVRFGFNIIRGEILNSAKYGVWSYHHDDPQVIRGGPPCFWEMYLSLPTTGAILQRLTDKLDGGEVLYEGNFQTHQYSYRKNIDQAFLESAKWLVLVAKKIQLHPEFKDGRVPPVMGRIYKAPNSLQMLYFMVKCLFNFAEFLVLKLFYVETWNVAVSRTKVSEVINAKTIEEEKLNWLPKLPRGQFLADPFIYDSSTGLRCLVEHYFYGDKGIISEVSDFESPTYVAKEVINDNFHYSYPHIFDYQGDSYFIPECYESGLLKLYKNIKGEWVYIKQLMKDVKVVDSTLLYYQDRYWIFCTVGDKNPNLNLYIYSCEELDGEYVAHPLNPVKSNVCSSRPGGDFIMDQGTLYRPAQNSEKTYGGSLVINKIDALTTTDFSESFYCELAPTAEYPDGLHTLSHSNNHIAIDGKKITFNIFAWLFRLKQKLKKNRKKVGQEIRVNE